jgi:hypothetical protein
MAAIHMRIVQGPDLIADLPKWKGPVPRAGDYIFHPPYGTSDHEGIAGSVACVKWRTHDRTPEGDVFVMTEHPYVEVVLNS